MQAQRTPVAVTIAGSDSSGGAGIQADLKTFSALGAYGASVITALTAQNTRGVQMIEQASPAMIRAQIDALRGDLEIGAVKIGMLGDAATIEAVAEGLDGLAAPIVLDPVMVAKSGDALLAPDAVDALRRRLLPRAALLTPNIPEAARLLGQAEAASLDAMEAQGSALRDLGAAAVLMKGGHMAGAACVDLLITADGTRRLAAPRHPTRNTHGTGCTLSSAIAALLARGRGLGDAAAQAHSYLQGAIAAADGLGIGAGAGPVHHFHALWQAPK
ncbi:MAG: bifunctional hydroxymethylpyrimidine kinase/phosphomethylpyrimidine kinase [Paracoccus sp. (in: a-proteobacteria)]|nr:bifunctional hydroxymethylpyrimidine kinase/phosphomethylpyrimidine kinase [Paracoccus sp. (in: a-proteobacteria)]